MKTNRERIMEEVWPQLAKQGLNVMADAPVERVLAAAQAVIAQQAERAQMLEGLERLGWPCRLVELPEYAEKTTKELLACRAELAALKSGRSPAASHAEEGTDIDVADLWSDALKETGARTYDEALGCFAKKVAAAAVRNHAS